MLGQQLYQNYNIKPLSLLSLSDTCKIMGIITHFKPVCKTRGSDYCQTLFIQDSTVKDSIQLLLFHSNPEYLPKVQIGSVLSVTVKVQQFSGKLQCVGLKGYAFDAQLYPKSNHYLQDLYQSLTEWWISMACSTIPINTTPSNTSTTNTLNSMTIDMSKGKYKRTCKTISDLIPNEYCDVNVMLVSAFPSQHDSFIVIQVTDYTSNPSTTPFTSDINPFGLKNDMTLRVTLWDQNKERCAGLNPGVFLSLTNMKSKISNDGYLEGVIHGDKNHEKVNVQVLNMNDERLKSIKSRQFKLDVGHLPRTKVLKELPNQVTPISQIPKSKGTWRINVKILHLLPLSFADFARPICHACEKFFDPSSNATSCDSCNSTVLYEFAFSFLVTDGDGNHTLPISVSGKEAERFLNGVEPCNLHLDNETLDKLINRLERLFFKDSNDNVCNQCEFELLVQSFQNGNQDWRYFVADTQVFYLD